MKTALIIIASGGFAATAKHSGLKQHPVREEIVDEIKQQTSSWTPKEVGDNHLRHVPVEQIHMLGGNKGMDHASVFEYAATAAKEATGMLSTMLDFFGLSESDVL